MFCFRVSTLNITREQLLKSSNIINFVNQPDVNQIKRDLNEIKNKLDNVFQMQHAKTLMKGFDPFINKKYKIAREINAYNVTNAWLKCYEIIDKFNLVDAKDDCDFSYFDNASYPGSFIIAVNHYVKTKTNIKKFNWYGSSLIDKENLGDNFNLYKNYTNNWLMNINNNGDITKLSNILDFQNQLNDVNDDRTVNLYSCDLGMDWGNKYNEQESISFNANICQIICGLLTLKSNGHMFIKHFTLFEPFTISYISLLTVLFKDVYITKPLASKRTNSEVYIVCKYYKYPFDINSVEHDIMDLLLNRVIQINKKDIKPEIQKAFISSDVISEQIKNITTACKYIYESQYMHLNHFIYAIKNITKPMVSGNCRRSLTDENNKIIKEYQKIKILQINSSKNLTMKQLY
jgi:hypothetical protein